MQGLRSRVAQYLAEGSSPEKLAWAMALGATCGLFPIYGLTTAVSAAAGVVFRVNPIVVQLANYLMYPIYFPVEMGFILAGGWLFGDDLELQGLSGLQAIFSAGLVSACRLLGRALLHAVLVWLIVSPFLAIALRITLLQVIRRWPRS